MLNKKLDQLISDLKDEIGLLLSISFGIFLFVLFFQPFTFDNFDFNNRILFVAGLGAIIFLSMVLVRITIPGLFRKENQDRRVLLLPAYFNGFMIVLLSSLAFVFYLRFVGMLDITFFLTIKIILICLAPTFILAVYDYVDELKRKNDLLLIERKSIQKQIEKYEEDFLNKSVIFNSENNSENFSLLISEVVFIKSADNYVEIIYREGDDYRKKLIRNTLRNVELQIRPYSNFIRCHRICIVNLHFVEKLIRNDNNHWLVIRGYEEKVPVSRQYLLKLREAI
jgi:DNA-binding LytR/AlgR family response regulator